MKRFAAIVLSAVMALSLAACSSRDTSGTPDTGTDTAVQENASQPQESTAPETDAAQNILIAYFSNTGNTEEVAQQIADLTGGTLAEIQRAEDYDTIFVGYPIWWDKAPAMIATFLESYDFSGKTIIPFTSHGGSGFSGTIGTISELQPGASVLDNGLSVSRNHAADAQSDLADWISSLDIL